ncbi:MAG: hypothetical protein K2N05_08725 [Muribaculaceae bacterium]|nr:hypothetical protein [Muribaculaceae bacterium]
MKILALFPNVNIAPDDLPPFTPYLSFPDSSIVRSGNPVFLPDFDDMFIASFFLAVKICRLGKSISQGFASRYYTEVAPAFNITAANTLALLRENSLPWSAATGFDKSVAIGDFISYEEASEGAHIMVEYIPDTKHPESAAPGNVPILLPSRNEIDQSICRISSYNSLKMGDIILIPVDFPAVALNIDSLLKMDINDRNLLKISVK